MPILFLFISSMLVSIYRIVKGIVHPQLKIFMSFQTFLVTKQHWPPIERRFLKSSFVLQKNESYLDLK